VKRPIPFGKYYLLDRINVGGMAEVFRAKAFGVEGFERLVAVKRILPNIAEDTDFITMFIDEAKLAVQLNHANIAQIFDLGKVGDAYFIALEYLHGKDLRAVFDLARKEGRPVPIGLAVYALMKACEGLDYAHNKKDASGRDLELVHRDVSPQNILVSFDGDVKLIDFGIAKAIGKANKTQAGILKGKFGYLSPEQVEGAVIDRRSDVFGVGIILFELLTGQRLFAGDSDFSTIEKVRSVEIPSPRKYNSKIPEELEQIVLKALARNVADRFQTAMELHDELQKFLYARGESFSRRDLSAWMRAHFAEEAEGDQDAIGELGPQTAPHESIDVAPILEPAESNAVIHETREAPSEQGNPKNKSTLLGMAIIPPADADAGLGKAGRSVPPPPPRGGSDVPPPPPSGANGAAAARSMPPPPPRGGNAPPPAPPSAASLAPASSFAPPPPPSSPPVASPVTAAGLGMVIPSVKPTIPPSAGRSGPPPPPRGGMQMGAALPAQNTPEPASAPTNGAHAPGLDMDWDDEELSTQIYDRPEDQLGMAGYENVEGGYEDLDARAREERARGDYGPRDSYVARNDGYGARNVETLVPGAQGYGMPAVHVSPRAYISDAPQAHMATPVNARAMQMTQPIGGATQVIPAAGNRNTLFAALGVVGVLLVSVISYFAFAKGEPGVVQLTTFPGDAIALFDGEPFGSTSPFLKTGVTSGEKHLLEVRKDGFRSWSQEVQVQPGQTLQFPITLQPANGSEAVAGLPGATDAAGMATGGFSLESTPPGAKVYLDGQELGGVTPLRVANLVPKEYDVRLRMSQFREHTMRVDVRSGVDVSLPRVALQPERLQVRISSDPPGADAAVVRGSERRELGRTPLSVSLDNNGAPWLVEVNRSGFEPFRQEVVPDGMNEVRVNAMLLRAGRSDYRSSDSYAAPRPSRRSVPRDSFASSAPAPSGGGGGGTGTLRINSKPWSQVYVDGKLIGNTPQMNVPLSEGTHRITLNNPEFGLKKNLSVNIRADQTETQIVNLQ
jgi:serine/threonine protein kinase